MEIPVTVRGEERSYYGRVQASQYSLRFFVDIDGTEVIFERDDAGEFRAILPEGFVGKAPEKEVITAIIEVLAAI